MRVFHDSGLASALYHPGSGTWCLCLARPASGAPAPVPVGSKTQTILGRGARWAGGDDGAGDVGVWHVVAAYVGRRNLWSVLRGISDFMDRILGLGSL